MWKTGYTIRATLDPLAREGTDFKIVNDSIVLVLNKNAIKVIPESLQINDLISYFKLVGKTNKGNQALLDKSKRRLNHQVFSDDEINKTIGWLKKMNRGPLWKEWFSFDFSNTYLDRVIPDLLSSFQFLDTFHHSYIKNIKLDPKKASQSDIDQTISFLQEKDKMQLWRAWVSLGLAKDRFEIYKESRFKDRLLLDAVKNNDQDFVRTMLNAGANPSAIDRDSGFSTLHIAAKKGYKDIILALLQGKANINIGLAFNNKSEKHYNWSPLHFAVYEGREDIVDLLLKSGADINFKSRNLYTPLHIAIFNDHENIVKTLLKKGADVHQNISFGPLPLQIASSRGNEKIFQALIDFGAHIHAVSHNKKTPLHLAAEGGHKGLVKMLIDLGADVNNQENSGKKSPLHYIAARPEGEDIVQLLIDSDANVNAKNHAGLTPLHFAVDSLWDGQKNTRILKILIQSGADPRAQDDEGRTPLHYARRSKKGRYVRLLLNAMEKKSCTKTLDSVI